MPVPVRLLSDGNGQQTDVVERGNGGPTGGIIQEHRLVVDGDFGHPGEKAGLTKAVKQAAWTQVAEKINRSVNNLTNVNKTYRYIV